MKYRNAIIVASIAFITPTPNRPAAADCTKSTMEMSRSAICAFAGANESLCVAGRFAKHRSAPVQALVVTSSTKDALPGGGATGSVPRIFGRVPAANYLTDVTCATDQTSNLNAASRAAGVGGMIELPAGCIATGPITPLAGQHWNGAGSSFNDSSQYDAGSVVTSGGTTIAFGKATGNLFPLVGSGSSLRNVALVDTYGGPITKTSTAVQFGNDDGPGDSANGNPESQGVENIRIYGFATQIDVRSGEFWRIRDFELHNAATYAVRVRNAFNPDSGDGRLVGGTIYGFGTDGIRFESGGGLKMGFTKILGGQHAIEVAMADGAATSDFEVVSTNSFENQTGASILLGCGGSGKTGMLNGSHFDPQMAGLGTAGAGAGIDAEGCVQGVDIGGYYGGFSAPLVLNGGSNFTIHPRGNNAVTSVALNIAAAVYNVQVPTFPKVSFNKGVGGSGYYNVIDNRTTDDGVVDRTDTRYLSLPVSSSYTTLYGIGVPAFRGARATVEVEGIVRNVGAVHIFEDVLLTPQGSTTVSAISSFQGSTSLDLKFALRGQTYSVNMRANGSQNAKADFQGSLSIKVQGKTNTLQID